MGYRALVGWILAVAFAAALAAGAVARPVVVRGFAYNYVAGPLVEMRLLDTAGGVSHILPGGPGIDPALSPDGSRVIFVRLHPAQRISDIDVLSLRSGTVRTLCAWPAIALGPRWSPDQRHIAFYSISGGPAPHSTLEVMDASGANARAIGQFPACVPRWSPDGGRLACIVTDTGGDTGGIGVIDLRTNRVTMVHRAAANALNVVWMPDGKHLVFLQADGQNSQAWLVRDDGSDLVQLTSTPTVKTGLEVSGDGRRVYLSEASQASHSSRLYALDLATHQERSLLADTRGNFLMDNGMLLFFLLGSSSSQQTPPSSPPSSSPSSTRQESGRTGCADQRAGGSEAGRSTMNWMPRDPASPSRDSANP